MEVDMVIFFALFNTLAVIGILVGLGGTASMQARCFTSPQQRLLVVAFKLSTVSSKTNCSVWLR